MLRNICFTLNNWTGEDEAHLVSILKNETYGIYGEEVGKEGTSHLQGYAELKTQTRLTTLKKRWGDRYHFEQRYGTQEQAITYCKKDGKFHEFGTPRVMGHRSDLDKARRLATEYGMREVTAVCSYQQIQCAEKYLTYHEEGRDFKPTVIWIHGPTGSGKSRMARELCGEDVYIKNNGTKWWDRYDRHEFVIIDDFRASWWPLEEMLSLLDRYEKQVEVKGGWRQFLAKTIIITTIIEPKDHYSGQNTDPIEQLLRRIDKIICVSCVSKVEGNTIPQPSQKILAN